MCGRHTPKPIRCVGSTRGGVRMSGAPHPGPVAVPISGRCAHLRSLSLSKCTRVTWPFDRRFLSLSKGGAGGARYSAFDSRRMPASVSICFACDV